jgi:large subunit ribosomal protein L17
MRHLKRKRNLGISPSHRSALLANLATSIFDKERIITTIAKAKEVRGVVERLITYGKRGGLHAIRLAAQTIRDKTILHKLFTDIAPSFKEREGGYTRIIKLGQRKGDNAMTAIFELVGRSAGEIARMRKKQKKQTTAAEEAKAPKSEAQEQAGAPPPPAPKAPKAKKEKPESKKKETVKAKKPKESTAKTEKKESPAAEKPEKPEKPAKAKKTETGKKKKTDKK